MVYKRLLIVSIADDSDVIEYENHLKLMRENLLGSKVHQTLWTLLLQYTSVNHKSRKFYSKSIDI